jgi:hypothetical protein
VIGGRGFGQFGEQVREVRVRLDAARLGGFDDRIQPRAGRGAGDCLAKEPVFSSDAKRSDRVLHSVCVERDFRMIEEAFKFRVLTQHVKTALPRTLCGRTRSAMLSSQALSS